MPVHLISLYFCNFIFRSRYFRDTRKLPE